MIKSLKNILLNIRGEASTEKLINMGLKVGENFNKQRGCIIDYSHCWLISIGNNVTFAPRVHVLAHDASTKKIMGYTKIGLVDIGDNVFVGANSTILPNVKIGKNSIIGANSLVSKNVPENVVVAGNPARVICSIDDYKNKIQNMMNKNNTFDSRWTIKNITLEQKKVMVEKLKNGIGFIE